MTGFGAVLWAELRKLLSRPIARVALIAMVALGVLGPGLLWLLAHSGIEWNGADLSTTLDACGANGLRWGLVLRNFLFAQIVLSVLASVSFAGELQSHTLREDLVRPVPRWVVLGAKWLALCAWSLVSLAAQAAVGAGVGLVALGVTGQTEWGQVGLAFGATWLAEASVALVALAVAATVRTVAGAFVILVTFLLFERFATWAAWALRGLMSMGEGGAPAIFELIPFTPSSAWSGWSELALGTDPSWQPWVALLAWTMIAGGIALGAFVRADVP